jgi:phage terminase large subunit|tara:strand:+ start:755 stop:2275 length:1521 start_codon:yes stop_codon:yes gene_type:complete
LKKELLVAVVQEKEVPAERIKVPARVKAPDVDVEKAQKVIFEPIPGPQTDFLSSTEQEVLYGGAAGGGKSYAMVADPVRYFNNPRSNMLLVRRSTEELRELISVSKDLYPKAVPGAKFLEREKTWVMPSGATLWMSYLDKDDDVQRYQGQAFNWIGFDELTQWPSTYAWNYMRTRLRTAKGSGLELAQRATSNPGGPGHSWVKKTFVDPAPANKAFWALDPETGEALTWPASSKFAQSNDLIGEPMLKRKFIPATLFDNPYLAEDGMYEANLLSMPDHLRRQLLEGDWDISEGAAFPEFNRKVHVVEPFNIPDNWTKFRAADYGYSSYTGIVWFAVDPADEKLVVYRELYVSKVLAEDLADSVLEVERGERIRYGVLDSSLWHKRGDTGPSIAERMIAKGCRWRPADRSKGSRVSGKNELHRRLQVDPGTGEPRMVFFNTCPKIIEQLPSIPLDKRNFEDVDTNSEDHLYDALRYGVMTRPQSDYFSNSTHSGSGTSTPSDPTFGY